MGDIAVAIQEIVKQQTTQQDQLHRLVLLVEKMGKLIESLQIRVTHLTDESNDLSNRLSSLKKEKN